MIDSSLFSHSLEAIYSINGATVRISNDTITDNETGLFTDSGGNIVSFGNNRLYGNTTDGAPTLTVAQQ